MKKSFAIATLLILASSNLWAQNLTGTPPLGNWNKVQSLPKGASLSIDLKYVQEVTCEFVRLDENSIVIKEYERERTFPKDSVARVKLMHPGSRARNAAIWGGIFFGAGFAIGYSSAAYVADQNSMPAGERAQVGAGIGAIMGGIAAAIARARHPDPRGEVIYKAR